MEGGELLVAGRPVLGMDAQGPRQGGGPAEQLLVEPVAEPTDRLRDEQPGCQRVGERREPDPLPVGADPRTEAAQRDGAPDAQAAFPDEQRTDRVAPRPK